ncbi:MAG: phosphatidylserine decarboxylase family protein [Rhodothermia bacterium]|nr:MAG: phosphatidylserine decarboxylase family protein [Rhodothermia bacterium]
MFAREGYALIIGSVVLGVLFLAVAFVIGGNWALLPGTIGVFVVAFTLYFFRDPKRTPPTDDENVLLSPADGKVIKIDELDETLFLEAHAKRVTIFLSPLNVHVNRIPANGVIEFVNYVSGDYLVAWHPKASELNERSEIGLIHPSGAKVLFKQIAGAVARRVVYHVSEGDRVSAGDRFGIVKFGSRMDIIVPETATFEISVGDKVRGGETILGYL